MQALGGDAREREARIDYLRFQLDELDAANLEPGEDVSLEVERARLASVDTLQSAARNAEERLYSGDASARDLVAGAAREIERAVRTDPSLGTLHEQLGQIETLVDDAADQLRTYADKLEGDPERLATVDERIALIRRLVRKHAVASAPRGSTASSTGRGTNGANGASAATANGTGRGEIASGTAHGASAATVHVASATASTAAADANRTTNGVAELSPLDTVIAKTDELRAELSTLVGHDGALAEAQSARAKAEAAAIAAAAVVTKLRQKAAKRLEKEVGGALAELGMAAAKLFVAVEPRPLGPTGADRIELMMASNKGEDTRPLAKIASGGELSRIMLALKLALRSADEVATYVFDEVDAGIGGATAQVVGAQIRSVADHRQVLCVTHLPQIAAYADQHFHVEKAEVGGRTETHVRKLTGTARKDELARMLGGHATSKAKAHAAELLAEAARTLEQPRESKRPRARA
jgi:DNA repair protein RecN (Recombination protein N)